MAVIVNNVCGTCARNFQSVGAPSALCTVCAREIANVNVSATGPVPSPGTSYLDPTSRKRK
jgi:hypothetical protein